MSIYSEENYKEYKIKILYDDFPEDPRTWDNLGKMVCFHKRYTLGDKHSFDIQEAKNFFKEENKNIIFLPLYLYDHSGITMNTTGFSCPWDSGQVGFIYSTKEEIKKEYSVSKISNKLKTKVYEILKNEVEIYDMYIRGEVFGFKIEKDGEEIDSCWGYFGYDSIKNQILPECKNYIDSLEKEENYKEEYIIPILK